MSNCIKHFILYFNIVIRGKRGIKGYEYRKVGNLPIVGVHHYSGYEIVNPNTNKVLYRKVKDWGIIGGSLGDYNPDTYKMVSKYFFKNAIQ